MNSGQKNKSKDSKNNSSASNNEANKPKEQKKKGGKESGSSAKKQRVFINRVATNPSVGNVKILQNPQTSQMVALPHPNYFGPQIPSDVMENILFRFLYNIPENEKSDQIRVCFHIELAHWFYLDIYCPDNADPPAENCKKVGFHQFVRQVFYRCDYLDKWRDSVDKIVDAFRQYKSSVPTYGVIMLDPTLNYVLLVQGYYASTNSWGFPKGKINEGELPVECAVREAFEEVGFDSKGHLLDKVRPLQCFIGETLVRLYIATDVPMDFPFKPHLRKEIRKISWFSIWDLPKNRNDDTGLTQLGLYPNNFYSVLPFISGICEFISRERAERKPKCSLLKQEGKSENSAFQPVVPKTSSDSKLPNLNQNQSTQNIQQTTPQQPESSIKSKQFDFNNLFKPLKIEPDNPPLQQSFTGQTFLEQFIKGVTGESSNFLSGSRVMDNEQVPKNPAGIIGAESRNRHKEIKQPKPLQHSNLILNVYEAPPQHQLTPQQENPLIPSLFSSIESPQKKQQTMAKVQITTSLLSMETPKKGKDNLNSEKLKIPKSINKNETQPATITGNETSGGNEIVNMLRSSIGKKELKKEVIVSELIPIQVKMCEAWKKFKFDQSLNKQLGELAFTQKV